jgi:thioredoxin 1
VSHVLYFTAEWCNPCKKTRPVAEELKREGTIDFIFVDVDFEPELVERFGVKTIPTFILLQDGLETKRMNGAKSKQEFIDFIGE